MATRGSPGEGQQKDEEGEGGPGDQRNEHEL